MIPLLIHTLFRTRGVMTDSSRHLERDQYSYSHNSAATTAVYTLVAGICHYVVCLSLSIQNFFCS